MANPDIRRRRAFGRWLKLKRDKMTQAEAVCKMSESHNIKITVETWSRWESGVRLPPETKINAIADVVEASPARARRLAGYKAPIKEAPIETGQRARNLVQRLLQEVLRHQEPETRMKMLYVMLFDYENYHRKGWSLKLGRHLELMQSIARAYETLYSVHHEAQAAAIMRIRKICEMAENLPLRLYPAYTATLNLPPSHDFPVPIGSKVVIVCNEDTADEISYNYMVDDLQSSEDKVTVAKLLYLSERKKRAETASQDFKLQ